MKREEIIGVWVNIFAGTTPDALQSSLPIESIGNGLTSRIIFVYEERKNKLVIIPTKTEREIRLQQALINDLEQIAMLSGRMQYTEGYLAKYTEWCYNADKNPPFYDRKFDGYCGRRRNHLLSLSMVCSASRSDELIMNADDFDTAAALLSEVEVKMGRVFKGMGRSDISSLLNDAVVYISNSKVPDIPIWQFAKHFEGDMDKIIMDKVITTLESMKVIKVIKRPGADSIIHILDF